MLTFEVRATLTSEPDKLSSGVGLGARLLIPQAALPATGLIQPGSLVRWSYRLLLDNPAPENLKAVMGEVREPMGRAGSRGAHPRRRDAPAGAQCGAHQPVLTLVALTALLVGGVGVANAVSSHLAAFEVIATLKALGATRRDVFLTYGAEIAPSPPSESCSA